MTAPYEYTVRDIRVINSEHASDIPAIHALVAAAFGQPDEADLVDRLRAGAGFIPELALCMRDGENTLLGHVLFTHCRIVDEEGQSTPSLALAPLSVQPEYQRQGVGKGLVRHGIWRATDMGFGSVIVLGHPDYYTRFGFQPAGDHAIHPPFALDDPAAFMVLPLYPGALAGVWGTVQYDPAFQL